MYELVGGTALAGTGLAGTGFPSGADLAGDFAASARELDALRTRVESQVVSLPRIDPTGWDGPASWACQLSLALLRRETDTAVELLRCAADLSSAAAFEAGQNA
jgi:hypothetical protein